MTAIRRLPALVTKTRAPEGSAATEKGVMPTWIVFTVRMPDDVDQRELAGAADDVGARALGRQRDRGRALGRRDLHDQPAGDQIDDRDLPRRPPEVTYAREPSGAIATPRASGGHGHAAPTARVTRSIAVRRPPLGLPPTT